MEIIVALKLTDIAEVPFETCWLEAFLPHSNAEERVRKKAKKPNHCVREKKMKSKEIQSKNNSISPHLMWRE